MKQEDKELLLRDLCARIPYGVKVQTTYINQKSKERRDIGIDVLTTVELSMLIDGFEEHKPYLFPLSSMTEEQKRKYNSLRNFVPTYHYEFGDIIEDTELYDNFESIDYLIANHFDYRGLIEKDLAIDCTNLNIY